MSSTIKIKRSNQSGNAPDTSNIVEGELALNTADGVLYSRGGNDIFEIGSNLTNADIDALVVNDSAQIDGKLEVSPSTASDTISLGSTSQTGAITLGQSTQTNTINVGNAVTASGSKQTINIGDNGETGSETEITIGSDDSASTTTLQGLTQIDQLKSNFSLPDGDNSITTVASSGKFMKLGTVEMQTDGQYYKASFKTYTTVDTDDRPPVQTELTLRCKGIGTIPSINISSMHDDYFETELPQHQYLVRCENDVGGGGAGPVRFHIWLKSFISECGAQIFIGGQMKSDNQVSVTYESSFAESSYLDSTDYFASAGSANGTSSSNALMHTTRSFHWDELFGTEPGIVRTTGGRGASSIRILDPSDGFLHWDSSNSTYSFKFDMVPNDPTTSITIGADDAASTVTLQGVTKIDQLAPRVITPTGDNSLTDVVANGKHIKIATIDLGGSGEYYKVNLETNYYGTTLGLGQDVARHHFVVISQGIGNLPAIQIRNLFNDVSASDTYPELKAEFTPDVSGSGSGPMRVDLYIVGKVVNNGMNVYVRDEFVGGGASLQSDVTWYESPDVTDYISNDALIALSGTHLTGTTGVGFNTQSNNMDDLFGASAGIVKTTGGVETSAISAVDLSEGFLHYDSATETFSHTYDMLPSDPATSITIGDSDGTGPLYLGTSKLQQAVSINSGVGTTSGSIKQTNISTGQANGSCDINIGPTSSAVTSLVDILGSVTIAGNRGADTIKLGKTDATGTITIGQSTSTNTIDIGAAAMTGLVEQRINIGNNKGLGASSLIKIGDNGANTGNTQITIGSTNTSGTQTVQINSETTFSNGDVTIDNNLNVDSDLVVGGTINVGSDLDVGGNLEVDGTIRGRYDVIMPFTSSTSMSQTDFKGVNSGTKIINMRTTDVTIDADFQPTTADIGKHWTIVNATDTASAYVRLDLGSQYVRLMSGGSQYASNNIWKLGRGGVAELVCIDTNVNGGGQSTPNWILYGNELSTL